MEKKWEVLKGVLLCGCSLQDHPPKEFRALAEMVHSGTAVLDVCFAPPADVEEIAPKSSHQAATRNLLCTEALAS
eukprot:1296556-Amphidinium_carterae.1